MPAKRARSATAAEPEERKAPPAPGKGKEKNEALAAAFEQLMYYESKGGNRWAGKAYSKVVEGIRAHKTEIKSGKEMAKLPGFGKASVEKIDEFLATGTLAKLTEFAESLGPLPKSVLDLPAKSGTAAGAKASPGKAKPLSKAVLKKIADMESEVSSLTMDQLKSALRVNRQVVTGTKSDLVERVAQGKVLGAIPTCPLCGAGKLRYNMKTGIYSCPGYMDDDTFAPCIFSGPNVERTPWKEEA